MRGRGGSGIVERDDLGAHRAREVAGREPLLDERAVHRADGQEVPVERPLRRGRHAGHHVEVPLGEVARRSG